ncbi:MAG: hypothetical protein QM811_25315 [Pirellulales bacterium]
MSHETLDALDAAIAAGGPTHALESLAKRFSVDERYHELFDTRLMQARLKLGLPAAAGGSLEELPDPERTKLEEAYLEACAEIGGRLLDKGRLREAWLYLRPTGKTEAVAAALRKLEVDEDNVEELLELALHERIAPRYGFELLLTHHGTCNAITVYDTEIVRTSKADQQACAKLLADRLHAELTENLRTDIGRREGKPPAAVPIAHLIADRDWLFAENNYHIDTTHMNSVVRIGRIVEDPAVLKVLVDLCAYGKKLAKQFHFEGDPPFELAFADHELFFDVQLGNRVDEGLKLFGERAANADPLTVGTGPAKVYVELLRRIKRLPEAIDAAAKHLGPGVRTAGFAPTLLELSREAGDYAVVKRLYRERDDALNYAAALVAELDAGKKA